MYLKGTSLLAWFLLTSEWMLQAHWKQLATWTWWRWGKQAAPSLAHTPASTVSQLLSKMALYPEHMLILMLLSGWAHHPGIGAEFKKQVWPLPRPLHNSLPSIIQGSKSHTLILILIYICSLIHSYSFIHASVYRWIAVLSVPLPTVFQAITCSFCLQIFTSRARTSWCWPSGAAPHQVCWCLSKEEGLGEWLKHVPRSKGTKWERSRMTEGQMKRRLLSQGSCHHMLLCN
jgi:hypothetical protein